ncbi:hypothetical protein [Rickettsiales endosymbiont of Peranema trichophorum]|uniref:hypothetical protein n=1 Tax=Rickettsiales endosymbiont of Peranema trichophorum TaxID=2486577 RepID=UPI001A93062E|nr:hypothetical protein [Rickettsiales endosymbiont of Peranema trichophorum]
MLRALSHIGVHDIVLEFLKLLCQTVDKKITEKVADKASLFKPTYFSVYAEVALQHNADYIKETSALLSYVNRSIMV